MRAICKADRKPDVVITMTYLEAKELTDRWGPEGDDEPATGAEFSLYCALSDITDGGKTEGSST